MLVLGGFLKKGSKALFENGSSILRRSRAFLLSWLVLSCTPSSRQGHREHPVAPSETAIVPLNVKSSVTAQSSLEFARLKLLVAKSESKSNVLVMPNALPSLACQNNAPESGDLDSNLEGKSQAGPSSLCLRPAWITVGVRESFHASAGQSFQTDFLRFLQPSTPSYVDPKGRYTISAIELEEKATFLLFLVPEASYSLGALVKELSWKELSSALSRMPLVELARFFVPRFSLGQNKKNRFELSEHLEEERDPSDRSPPQSIPVEGVMPEIAPLSIDRPFLALVVDASKGSLMTAAAIFHPESRETRQD